MEPSNTEEPPPLFTSGEIPLTPDSSISQLSKPPKDITKSTPRVQSQTFLNWAVRADITSLYQGTYKSRPATLLILTVNFLFPSAVGAARRLSEARIILTFRHSSSSRSKQYPIVRAVIPKLLEGPATPSTILTSNTTATTLSVETAQIIGVTVGPKAEVSASHTRSVGFERDQLLTIRGTRWPSKEVTDLDLDIDNVARWELAENNATGRGIPGEFRCGVVVEHDGEQEIEATVKIAAQTKMGLSLFGWPWSENRPVVIQPGTRYSGEEDGVESGVVMGEFSEMGDDKWKLLCRVDVDVAKCKWV
ncbi:hypothetical protein B0H66DRAFT_568603 [Apodospora peruviana]|uniref:Uncharacterized protein n=1 Tax=Apodospora peruviana TaxID=516989 RepID=A0AAE0HVC8_9PEZI|nr:hypothetical protein B0H66DRAFT_568603 [Apodospora peruviana]